ncbi:hypothetical protein ABVT39_000225 [Epinephelus coioides]
MARPKLLQTKSENDLNLKTNCDGSRGQHDAEQQDLSLFAALMLSALLPNVSKCSADSSSPADQERHPESGAALRFLFSLKQNVEHLPGRKLLLTDERMESMHRKVQKVIKF